MNLTMDMNDATFKLSDVIKLITYAVTLTIFAVTIHIGLGNLKDSVGDIRGTQIENTKKNDLRWEAIGLEINQLKMNQSLLQQRIEALENKK